MVLGLYWLKSTPLDLAQLRQDGEEISFMRLRRNGLGQFFGLSSPSEFDRPCSVALPDVDLSARLQRT